MEATIYILPDEVEIMDSAEYCMEINEHFTSVPKVAESLLSGAKTTFKKIE